MKIVTTGMGYVDIDAYGGCVAYAELLQMQGIDAVAISTSPLNESVSRTVRSWNAPFETEYHLAADDTFVVIDVSDPDHFDKIVDLDNVQGVIDHHPGFEEFWQNRIGDGARIEFIGAACTLVYECWVNAGLLEKISTTSARLLICGILDNTLDFNAGVNTRRDVDAYSALLALADLPENWTAQYFTECQEAILNDASAALQNDTKSLVFKSYSVNPMRVGQLVVWEGAQVITKHLDTMRSAFMGAQSDWFINIVSIGEKKNYFVADSTAVQDWLSKLFSVQFEGSVAHTNHLLLRKEIIKQDIDTSSKTE